MSILAARVCLRVSRSVFPPARPCLFVGELCWVCLLWCRPVVRGVWRLSRGILRDLRGSISSPTAHAGGLSMEVRPSAPPAAIGYYYLNTIIQSIPQWASVSLRLLRPEERGVVLPQRGSRLNGDEG